MISGDWNQSLRWPRSNMSWITGDRQSDEDETDMVEALRRAFLTIGRGENDHQARDHTERQDEFKRPPPVQQLRHQAAEGRPEDRAPSRHRRPT